MRLSMGRLIRHLFVISLFGCGATGTVNCPPMDEACAAQLDPMQDSDGDGVGDTLRTWSSLTTAADEAGMAQIYAGINFAYSVNDGKTTGQNVAGQVLNNYFAQIPEPSGLLLGLAALSLVQIRRRRRA